MSANSALDQMQKAWQTLNSQWQTTNTMWNDEVKTHFEGEFWTPIKGQTPMMILKLQELTRVISQTQQNVQCR
jgi:hypothetical protein